MGMKKKTLYTILVYIIHMSICGTIFSFTPHETGWLVAVVLLIMFLGWVVGWFILPKIERMK